MTLEQLIPSRTASLMVMIVTILVSCSALYFFVLKDPLDENRRLSAAFSDAEIQLTEAGVSDQLSHKLDKDETELEDLRKKLYFQSEGRQSSEIVPYVVSILDEISRKYNIRLTGVTPLEVKNILMLEELPFDITISGSYPQIYQWLAEAEEALDPMAVKNFTINPSSRDFGVTMKMRVVSYRLPMEEG